jgi:hypothetical protein
MKTILMALMLLASCANIYSQACCCSSTGGSYNILPDIDKHVVGMRYTYSSYNSTTYAMMNMNMNGMDMTMMGAGVPTNENMSTLDLFGRFALPKRFFISVFAPVHILDEKSTSGNQRTAGLGDLSVLLQYAVIDNHKCNGKISKHQLRLGAGVKTPTGKFSMTPDGMFTTDLQLGTGSFDFIFNAIYTYRYKQFGFNLLASYKKNLENAEGFRFGDKVKGGLEAFYIFNVSNGLQIMPKAGVSCDHSFFNIDQKQVLTYTGGENIIGSLGFDIYYKNIAFTTSVSPVLLSITNWAGEPYQRYSVETGLYYSFSNIIKHKKDKQNGKEKSL